MTRLTFIFAATLAAAACLLGGIAGPAFAVTPDDVMHDRLMLLRGFIDRAGASRSFHFPPAPQVRAGGLGGSQWPADPWTGAPMTPGDGRGHYRYTVSPSRRSYRLVGHLTGGAIVLRGGMPRSVMLAYDHRGEESLNLIRQYIETWARAHDGLYPLGGDVAATGAVGLQAGRQYWPSNPWDHHVMGQRSDSGSFSYEVAPDRSTYALRLHRALKHDYVLMSATGAAPWRQLLTRLEDQALHRGARVLAGYVDRWALKHGGELPKAAVLAARSARPGWPPDPITGSGMRPGVRPGTYSYAPGAAGAYTLTVHLRSGEIEAGGTAPTPVASARGSGFPLP